MKKGKTSSSDIAILDGLPVDSFVREFKYKQFARNFVALNGDVERAFRRTFGDMGSARSLVLRKGDAILARPEVEMEIQHLLPSDQELNSVISKAIAAPTGPLIGWSEKHKYVETALKLKGYLGKDDDGGTTNNVVMFVEHGRRNESGIQTSGDGGNAQGVGVESVPEKILDVE